MTDVSYQRVLAAVDFSDWTPPVLRVAGDLAGRFGARLTIAHAEAFQPPPYFTEAEVAAIAGSLEHQRRAAAEALTRLAAGAAPAGQRYETQLVEAAPADGILRAARDGAADLVVMGTHGRTGLNRLLLGSVAERVVRESAVPVLTVRHDAGGGPDVRLPFRRILCPVNDTEVARLALRHAAAVAGRYGAELTLLACVESRQDGPDPEALLAELARDHAAGAYEVKTALRRGHAAEQVLQAAADGNSDLIVIGAQHRPLMETTIFGTTSVRVLRHAARPVLTVIRHER